MAAAHTSTSSTPASGAATLRDRRSGGGGPKPSARGGRPGADGAGRRAVIGLSQAPRDRSRWRPSRAARMTPRRSEVEDLETSDPARAAACHGRRPSSIDSCFPPRSRSTLAPVPRLYATKLDTTEPLGGHVDRRPSVRTSDAIGKTAAMADSFWTRLARELTEALDLQTAPLAITFAAAPPARDPRL